MPRPELGDVLQLALQARVFGALFKESAKTRALGRYVVRDVLGQGGMGVVLRAHDKTLGRQIALKVLHESIGEGHTVRLRREAQALARLSHPNVVQVYEVGQFQGRTFVAMELVTGQTLKEWTRQYPRPTWKLCLEIFIQLGSGLAAAHARGLVHRDFKPGNAIIDRKGRARVLDFGLACRTEDDEAFSDGVPSMVQQSRTDKNEIPPLDVSLTRTGTVMGTPAYMPPEQMLGDEVDARSDQFSFCVSLYEALYGERPFDGDSMAQVLVASKEGRVRAAPKNSKIPVALRKVVLRGLEASPDQRWPSMEILVANLRRFVAPRWVRWFSSLRKRWWGRDEHGSSANERELRAPTSESGPSHGSSVELSDRSTLSGAHAQTKTSKFHPPKNADLPDRIDRYLVLGALGRGSMASVYRAYDEELDRPVAVKLVHSGPWNVDRARTRREALALARLSHPNVVQVYEFGEFESQLFIAMELVEGKTLDQWQQTPRVWAQCLAAYVQAGRGLAAAHAASMIHRDFKPSNCIMDERGRVCVFDFRLARHSETARILASSSGRPLSVVHPAGDAEGLLEAKLTDSGMVLGTPAYMAPEQMSGEKIDARADQYSFCVSLYEALFGELPKFDALSGQPITEPGAFASQTSGRNVPRWLTQILDRGLQRKPENRWPSLKVMLDAIEHRQRQQVWVYVGRWATVGLLIVVVVLLLAL